MIYEEFKITPAGMSPWYDYNTSWYPDAVSNIREFVLNRSDVGDRIVVSFSGLGMPNLQWITDKTPYNDGELFRGFRAQKREIDITIRANGCSREEYWNLRSELIEALRPRIINNYDNFDPHTSFEIWWGLNNLREGSMLPARLTITLPGNVQRAIDVYYMDGAVFQPRNLDDWDEYGFEDTITLVCPYPYFYDPNWKQAYIPENIREIWLDYHGTAVSKPLIVATNVSFTGTPGAGQYLQVFNSIPDNRYIRLSFLPYESSSVIINTAPGRKRAVYAPANSLGDYTFDITEHIEYNSTGFAEFSLGPYGSRMTPADRYWEHNTIGRLAPFGSGIEIYIKYYEYYMGI